MPRDGTKTRTRILDAAERLVIDNGFSATSVEAILEAAPASKGAFFHHFPDKSALALALVERYAQADIDHLGRAVESLGELSGKRRVLAFLRYFEREADELMAAQSSCLYVALVSEQQLMDPGTEEPIRGAIQRWRDALVEMLAGAETVERVDRRALADHVFVTFEGAFVLCRATGDNGHMRRQLRVLRTLFGALLV